MARMTLQGLLKKAVSGVLAIFLDLRAHNNGAASEDGPSKSALRAVSAHVFPIRSARKTMESLFETSQAVSGLAERTFLNRSSGLVTEGVLGKYGV